MYKSTFPVIKLNLPTTPRFFCELGSMEKKRNEGYTLGGISDEGFNNRSRGIRRKISNQRI